LLLLLYALIGNVDLLVEGNEKVLLRFIPFLIREVRCEVVGRNYTLDEIV